MGADVYRPVESIPARGIALPTGCQAEDDHTHVGDRRAGTVADRPLDAARGEALASGGAEERGSEGEGRTGGVGQIVSCGPGCKLK
jgi:hypothetical protein